MDEDLFRVEATALAARFDGGHYEGGSFGFALLHEYVAAEVALPVYGIERDGQRDRGIGDLLLGARAPVYRLRRAERERFAIGPEIAVTLPTGDSDKALGMGHVMLMPGLFGRFRHERFTLSVSLAYGVAVGDHGHAGHGSDVTGHEHHAHHGHDTSQAVSGHAAGPWPIVNPMNRSELEHAVTGAYQFADWFTLALRVYGAVPVGDDDGEAREIVAPAGVFTWGPTDFTLTGEVPVLGDPFDFRTTLGVAIRF